MGNSFTELLRAIGTVTPVSEATQAAQGPPVPYRAPVRRVGNIDLSRRPIVRGPDGSVSTVRSMSFQDDQGREVLVPTVSDDGRLLSDDQAIDTYRRTGRHLGVFGSPREANAYARQLHQDQARRYAPPPLTDAQYTASERNMARLQSATPLRADVGGEAMAPIRSLPRGPGPQQVVTDLASGVGEIVGTEPLARGFATLRQGGSEPGTAMRAAPDLALGTLGLAGLATMGAAPRMRAPIGEPVTPIPQSPARVIGPGGLPIREPQPFRQSFVGGTQDLNEAARLNNRPDPHGEGVGAQAPREVVDFRTPRGETHMTIRNPSEADLVRLTREDPSRPREGSATERGASSEARSRIRYIRDGEDIYVGNSYDVTHHDLLNAFGLNARGRANVEGGIIIRHPDGSFELQNDAGAAPMPRGWLRSGSNSRPPPWNEGPRADMSGGGGQPPRGRGIIAYHGSPHDFDRFDMSRIGTGEGAQAYGRGLYFAEQEDVAKAYRDALTPPGQRGRIYETLIDANPEDFIDLDRQMKDQPQRVRDYVSQVYEMPQGRPFDQLWYRPMPYEAQSAREAGLAGYRYLDQGSRGVGAGTRNLVVLDDRLIEILRKYGLAGLAYGGAGGAVTAQQNAPGR